MSAWNHNIGSFLWAVVFLVSYAVLPLLRRRALTADPHDSLNEQTQKGHQAPEAAARTLSRRRQVRGVFALIETGLLLAVASTAVPALVSVLTFGADSVNALLRVVVYLFALSIVTGVVVGVHRLRPAADTSRETPPTDAMSLGDVSILALQSFTSDANQMKHELLQAFFDYPAVPVENFMTPRQHMVALPETMRIREALDALHHTGFTRYPVFDREHDRVVGVLHFRDLLDAAAVGRTRSISDLVHAPLQLKRTTPAVEVLKQMREQQSELGVIVDDADRCVGIVTQGDLLDALLRATPVHAALDVTKQPVAEVDAGVFEIDGNTPIHQLLSTLEIDHEHPQVQSISAYVFTSLGRKPRIGDRVSLGEMVLTVNEVLGPRATKLRAKWPPSYKTSRSGRA